MDVQHLGETFSSLFKKRKRKTLYLTAGLVLLYVIIRVFVPNYLNTIPVYGGGFSEGMVGYPRFINPVLALSQTDKDITNLVYSGLFREQSDGTITQDLVASYSVNASSTEYTIVLRDDVFFHDNTPVTAIDIAFTYDMIRDSVIKSHLAPSYEGVDWEILDEQTIVFSLKNPQSNFEKFLTVGILPRDQWSSISREEFAFSVDNISPIGSGPYQIADINRNSDERITSYVLTSSQGYNQPYISTIEIKFYEDHRQVITAFESGLIDNLANISPQELLLLDHTLQTKNISSYPLDRSFVLFMNQSKEPVLAEKTVRSYLNQTINREQIISDVLFSRGDVATGPLPLSHDFYLPPTTTEKIPHEDFVKALGKLGWSLNEDGLYTNDSAETLELTLHVPEVRELEQTANIIAEQLSQEGINVTIISVPQDEIVNTVVRRRDYELLLFGQLVEDASSLYAFWHSEGIADPGINIAMYENKTVDAILERLISAGEKGNDLATDYANIQKEIADDVPAIFLYRPHFIYALDQKINNVSFENLRFAWDRFNSVDDWYIQTESLLPWFTP